MNETKVSYAGNETIDPLIANIQQLWRNGEADRLALGQYFSELKKATKPYQEDLETGLTYTSAVKRTGVPRSTAEYYRVMWEKVNENGIPAQVFLLLREAGFNLATDLKEGVTVQGIIHDHHELLTGDISDYDQLAGTLEENYGQGEQKGKNVAALQKFADSISTSMPDSEEKQNVLEGLEKQIHSKRISELKTLCLAIRPLLGKTKVWAEEYAKKYADSKALTRQRYEEAVRFAQSLIQE